MKKGRTKRPEVKPWYSLLKYRASQEYTGSLCFGTVMTVLVLSVWDKKEIMPGISARNAMAQGGVYDNHR